MTAAQLASVAIFGTLATTVFRDFHASVLGARFDTYDVLILIPGLLCLLAGTIAFVSLRQVSRRQEISPDQTSDISKASFLV